MTTEQQLKEAIAEHKMLNHPFYQAWMRGELSLDTLKNYTVQYYPHVKVFPRLVSAIHSRCEDAGSRQFLLQNLNEEEGFPNGPDHPELWMRFAEGLGAHREQLLNAEFGEKAQALADLFWQLCNSSYAEGLAALYTYEHQIPEISRAKIEGLKQFYGIQNPSTLEFFQVHERADEFHSKACAQLMDSLPAQDRQKAVQAGKKAAVALWDFLSEVHGENCACH